MLYQLKYKKDPFTETENVPEEVIIRDIISKFVRDIPLDELKALFGFEKETIHEWRYYSDKPITQYSLKFNTDMRDMKNLKEIVWTPRYSDTMSPDNQGRWARIAYIGNQDNFGFDEENRRRQLFEIAWISKKDINEEIHYVVSYRFPGNNKHLFETLEEAKEEVETSFRQFIKNCFK